MKIDKSLSAIIAGGASGLGEATARRLAVHGVKVARFVKNSVSKLDLASLTFEKE